MSRYKIKSSKYLIHVGYDQPLRTFFAIVENYSPSSENEDADPILLWVGDTYDEITSVAQLAQSIADYYSLPDNLVAKLEDDSREYFQPSYLQNLVEHMFNTFI